jgi:outer membrane receptor for ferrienterochelin and colicin
MRFRVTVLSVVTMIGLLITVCPSAWAGTNGNIRGKITDIETNEGLPLVNVLIVGSGRGGVTNDKGEYFITGVQAGVYTIRASLLGYQVFEAKRVSIDADETSVLDFKLASTLIEKEGITVEGTRPLVDVKKTAGEQTYTKEKIEQLPNVKGVEDVLGLQAGVVKFGQQLFLRGGRANETQILIDGVVVNDVGGGTSASSGQSTNEQLASLYSGNTSGGSSGALSVSANAIQSVSVSSSGLDAEFGNAQSGVVNITTKSGTESFTGSLQYRTDGITSSSFNERYYAGSVGGPEPITSELLPALGIELPGKVSFFASATFNQSDGPYGYTSNRFYNPLKRKVRLGFLNGLGFSYDDKQNNDFGFNMKFSYFVGDNDQFSYSYRANTNSSHALLGRYSFRDRYDSSASQLQLKTQNVLQWTHILGTNSLVKAYISRLETDNLSDVAGLTPDQYSPPVPSTTDPNGDGIRDIGTEQNWGHNNTIIWNTKIDYNSKVHDLHFLKAGLEYFYEQIRSTTIVRPTDPDRDPDSTGLGEFPGYGTKRSIGNNLPSRGALYIQDNIELTALTIKVGLRYDWFYLGKQVSDQRYVKTYEKFLNLERDPDQPYQYADWVDYNADHTSFKARSFFNQLTSGYFSPRLAIGYPISERTVFYFNYGHFLQWPERNQLFTEPYKTTANEPIQVGNPALKPQKTIQYEAGFDQLLLDDLSLGIRGYYKDISDYVATLPGTYSKWVNLDYASSRGFEVILTKSATGHYSGSLGYTFQLAKGRSSDPKSSVFQPQLAGLPRETRLDYDQQHTLNLFLRYSIPANEEFDVFGLNINNWGASVTWNYGSGFPYTPFNFNKGLQDFYLVNTGDGPYTSEINISLYKGFSFFEKMNVVFSVDVINLLNRKNVNLSGGGFNSYTGAVTSYGDIDPSVDPRLVYAWNGFDTRVSPFAFRPPRQISFGMKVNWN